MKKNILAIGFALALFPFANLEAKVCEGFGPQTPRDITSKKGENKVTFEEAPDFEEMNLCNIHFHKNAEHKGPEFSVSGGKGDFGGWKCDISNKLSKSELKKPKKKTCKNIEPGDTIEIHWVHSSCDVKPGKGLGSCLSKACANPQLRVETQVYVLVNDGKAVDMMDLDVAKKQKKGFYQAKKIPTGDDAIAFLGSTTGPSYTEEKCSPLQVTWNVSPSCQKMDINSVHKWCQGNIFEEDHAHGVRQLVKDVRLLSPIGD